MPNNDFIANLLGDWSKEMNAGSIVLKVVLAIVFAAIIGCERASNRHAAGLRTFILVSLASTLAAMGDMYFIKYMGASFSLLTASTIIGVAIISCNTILFSSKNQLKGLTTSVALWTNGVIGILLGLGQYTAGIVGFVALILCVTMFPDLENRFKQRSNHFQVHLELKAKSCLQEFLGTIREFGLKIDDIEANPAYANSGLGVYSLSLTVVGADLKKQTHAEIVEALAALECVYYIEEID
jgi:putative Mg2+ transporter-C (MgtC) family protein